MRSLLILFFFCAACSANPTIGSIGDHRVEVARVAGALHPANAADPVSSIDLILTDDPGFPCENVGRVLPTAARSLALRFFSLDGGTFVAPSSAGTYRVVPATGVSGGLPDGQYGYAIYVESDPLCRVFAGNEIGGHDGTLTLTQLSSTPGAPVAGSFDVTLLSTDRLAGSFATHLCAQATGDGACR